MFYVYILLNPLKPCKLSYKTISLLYEPFYVGKGKHKRAQQHFKDIKKIDKLDKSNNTYKNIILKRILDNNLEPYILIIEYFEFSYQAENLERDYISMIGRKDLKQGLLGNLTDGGDGISNISEETRARMSKSHIGKIPKNIEQIKHYWKHYSKEELSIRGKHAGSFVKNRKSGSHLPEVRDKISKSLTGIKRSTETRLKMSEAAKLRERAKTDLDKLEINLKISNTKKSKQHEPHNKVILRGSELEIKVIELFNAGYSIKDILKLINDPKLSTCIIGGCLKNNGFLKLYRRSKLV